MPALTGLRAFTATNIVFFHFWNPAWFGPLSPMMDNGYVGVNFFFLLSGFILAYNYSDRSDAGQFDRKQFWQTRFSRLYPVYVLGLLISIPILELEWKYRTHAQFFQGLGLTAMMQQGWSPRLCTFWNTPAWTLSCETVFYLLFPLLVAIKWPRQTRKLLLILAGCWLASLVIPLIYMWVRPDGLGPITRMSNSYWLRAVKMTPLPHLPTFTAGIVLSKLNDRMKLANRTRYWLAIIGLGSVCTVLMQGAKMPFLLMHNGLITPLFAIYYHRIDGASSDYAVPALSAVRCCRRGKLLPVYSPLQPVALDSCERPAGAAAHCALRSMDLVFHPGSYRVAGLSVPGTADAQLAAPGAAGVETCAGTISAGASCRPAGYCGGAGFRRLSGRRAK